MRRVYFDILICRVRLLLAVVFPFQTVSFDMRSALIDKVAFESRHSNCQAKTEDTLKIICAQNRTLMTQSSKMITNFESIFMWHFRHPSSSMQKVHIKCPQGSAQKIISFNSHAQPFVQSVSSSSHSISKHSRGSSEVLRGTSFPKFSSFFSSSAIFLKDFSVTWEMICRNSCAV